MLEKMIKFTKKNKGFLIATGTLLASSIFDSGLTLKNVNKYGIEFEGNPLLKESMKLIGSSVSLYGSKILASSFIIYAANKANKVRHKIKGETLLYAGATCWTLAGITNLFYL